MIGFALKNAKKLDKSIEERARKSTFLPDENISGGAATVLINATDEGDFQ